MCLFSIRSLKYLFSNHDLNVRSRRRNVPGMVVVPVVLAPGRLRQEPGNFVGWLGLSRELCPQTINKVTIVLIL